MRQFSIAVMCGASFVGWASLATAATGTGEGAAASSTSPTADMLVRQAIEAGLAGDVTKRRELLDAAIAADADHAPARWQSGQLQFEGQWRTPTEVAELVSNDPRWQEYRELRDASSGSLADHVALAQWCLRNGLSNEERFHWCNVILAAPGHKLARQRLSVREYRGGLFTLEQVAAHEQQLKDAEASFKKYKPRFIELARQARGEGHSTREAALAKIRAVTDPAAIPAIEAAIGRSKRDESDPRTRDLNLALVAALSNMREHEATLYLLNYAVFAQNEDVRKAAAEGLKPRATTDYVPLLMAALTAPIEAEFDVVAAPDGTVRMIETLRQSGPQADKAHVQNTSFEVDGVFGRDRMKTDPGVVLDNHLSRARAKAEDTQYRVESYNAAAAQRNARIQETLAIATGMSLGSDPKDYWKAWGAENELIYGEAPVNETYEEYTHSYAYQQAPKYKVSTGNYGPSGTTRTYAPAPPRPAPIIPAHLMRSPHMSCFAPGTPVWTQSGPVPIEQIVVGDLVLAQHPATGELAYRPVLETTAGTPVPVMQIELPGEAITTTLGHRFWVDGRGWLMAKQLKPAMALHAVDRAMDVTAIGKSEDVSCHNLVVDEFHTFFVGKSRLLVHDKNCPAPTLATIPGRASEGELSMSRLAN
jgi:hypothetical protein